MKCDISKYEDSGRLRIAFICENDMEKLLLNYLILDSTVDMTLSDVDGEDAIVSVLPYQKREKK